MGMTDRSAETQVTRGAWSPTGIAVLTLIFSPVLGGILHALNYPRLGRPGLRRFSLWRNLLAAALIFLPALLDLRLPGGQMMASLFCAAYFYKTQGFLFDAHRTAGGPKASLALPILLAVAAVVALAILLAAFVAVLPAG
jgi:hypothetical protein